MRIAFDTNVILDAVLERSDFKAAQDLVMAVATERVSGVVSANSITDIYYIARKMAGDETARQMVTNIFSVFDIAAVDGEICAAALNVPMGDYKDAVLAVCAARECVDYIATSDQGFLDAESPVPAKRPAQLLELFAPFSD